MHGRRPGGRPPGAEAGPDLDLGVLIASRYSATVGGAVATNAGGVRVLRFGPMRAQLRGIEAVLADTVTALVGLAGLDELHALARRAVREVPGLVSAEFFTPAGLDILVAHAGLAAPLSPAAQDPEAAGFLGVPVKLDVSVPAAQWVRLASLGGSISAEHGIGALKARWLPLARTEAERGLFGRIRSALDPAGTLNPDVLPR